MKIAVVFLLAALNSCYDAATVPQTSCLSQLLKDDAPLLLQSLATLLCKYQAAKEKQDSALFLEFLNQVNALLAKVDCTIGNILGTQVTITLQNAEDLGDQVAAVLFQFLENFIAKVTTFLDKIPIVDDMLNDKALIGDIRNVACGVLENVITKVINILDDITAHLD